MRTLIIIFILFSILSCKNGFSEIVETNHKISLRTLPNYIIPYQYPAGNVLSKTSADLQNWASGYTVSTTPARYGTSSTLYNFAVPDDQRRCLTIFQNSSNVLQWVEYEDGDMAWSSPASISTATSNLLPSVEMNDGVVYEVHKEVGSELVKGSYKNGSTWVTPYAVYRSHSSGFLQIESDFSPSLEYHASAGVEYLVTGYADYEFSGYGWPIIYWRYTNSYYTPASNPSMLTSLGGNDLNSSFTPVALVENGVNQLFLFWTESGTSAPDGLVIRYKKGDITGNFGDGTISWGNTSYSVSGAYTDHKIDGFFDTNTEEIVIVFRNYSTGEVDLAISSDFGANWTLETGVDDVSGAPSIVNLE